nr:aldehyde-alcohol dehydrogenase [Raoultella sp. NCTC 9187]
MAFTNASLGVTHSLAHALGGVFRVPHGRANALLMAEVVAWNADYQGGAIPMPRANTLAWLICWICRPPAPRGRRQPADRHSGIKR